MRRHDEVPALPQQLRRQQAAAGKRCRPRVCSSGSCFHENKATPLGTLCCTHLDHEVHPAWSVPLRIALVLKYMFSGRVTRPTTNKYISITLTGEGKLKKGILPSRVASYLRIRSWPFQSVH